MEDDDFQDLNPLLDRFEQMLNEGAEWFFDVQEFEVLSDYFYDSGALGKAIRTAEIAASQHPASTAFMIRKAQYFSARQDFGRAQDELQKLENIEPDSYDLWMTRASIFSQKEKHHRAISCYKEALKKSDFPEDVWAMMAFEYQTLGNYELAIKYLQKTLAVFPDDDLSLYNIALCYDLLLKSQEGIWYFRQFIDKEPYNETAWYHLGIFYAREQEFDKAVEALDYSILIDEYFIAAFYEKARILERTFRFAEAAETYRQSFETEGHTGYGLYKMGLCFLQMNQSKKAMVHLTKAIKEDPDLDEAYYELALIKDEENAGHEAVYFIKKALEARPEDADYMYVSADIHRRAGMLNEAEEIYQQMIELGLTEPEVYLDYAELLIDLCEFEEAIEVLFEGAVVNADSADLHFRLAAYLYIMGDANAADGFFQKGMTLDPERRGQLLKLFPILKSNARIQRLIQNLT